MPACACVPFQDGEQPLQEVPPHLQQQPIMSKAAAKEVVAASLPVHEAVLQAHQSVVTSLTARIRQRRVEERQQVRKRKGWKGKGRKGKERKELQQHRVTGRQQVRQRLGMRDAEQEACYVSYGDSLTARM
eukprot:806975-Pelagomonas_calceolata.AAC.1